MVQHQWKGAKTCYKSKTKPSKNRSSVPVTWPQPNRGTFHLEKLNLKTHTHTHTHTHTQEATTTYSTTKSVAIGLSMRILPAGLFHWRVKYVGRRRGSNDPSDPSAFPGNCTKVCRKHYTLRLSYNTYYRTGPLTSVDSKNLAPPVQTACSTLPSSSQGTQLAYDKHAQATKGWKQHLRYQWAKREKLNDLKKNTRLVLIWMIITDILKKNKLEHYIFASPLELNHNRTSLASFLSYLNQKRLKWSYTITVQGREKRRELQRRLCNSWLYPRWTLKGKITHIHRGRAGHIPPTHLMSNTPNRRVNNYY